MAEASFQQLIEMCNKIGWDKGIKHLEDIVYKNENAQAFYSENNNRKMVLRLSKIIIKQNRSIGRLKQYRKENNL